MGHIGLGIGINPDVSRSRRWTRPGPDSEKRFGGYSQMDLVIFNHAFARQALGQDKEADALYWSLIQHFPDSPLVPDAHLAIGEIDFQNAQFQAALDHFNAIRKYPESRVYPYGLYKAAWTRYNMRDTAGGLRNLEEVVAFGDSVVKNHLDAKLDLRKEALNDMTLFYEDVFPSTKAFSYFQKQAGESDLPPLIMKLADLYDTAMPAIKMNERPLRRWWKKCPRPPSFPMLGTR